MIRAPWHGRPARVVLGFREPRSRCPPTNLLIPPALRPIVEGLLLAQTRFRPQSEDFGDDRYHTTLELVQTHNIRSYRAHDARLVAAMETYGITRVLTFNRDDFKGFGISVVDPAKD